MASQNTKLSCLNSVKRTKDGKRPPTPVQITYVDVTKVIDRSGSVASMDPHGYGGFPQFIKDQKKTSKDENVEIRITFTTFDGAATTWYEDKDVNTFPDFIAADVMHQMVYPRGATLLVDTLMDAAVASSRRYNALVDKYGENNVSSILFVWTDGDDNQSHRWTTPDVNRVLAKIQENPKRTVLWTAANQDAMKSGARFGIAPSNCLTTQATPRGAGPMYRAASAAVTRGCSGGNAAFTPQERVANSRAATTGSTPTPNRYFQGPHPPAATAALAAAHRQRRSTRPHGAQPPPSARGHHGGGGGQAGRMAHYLAVARGAGVPVNSINGIPLGGGGGGGGGRGGSWGGPYHGGIQGNGNAFLAAGTAAPSSLPPPPPPQHGAALPPAVMGPPPARRPRTSTGH